MIQVAAAIILKTINGKEHLLIAERPVGKDRAGLWEFPGGKVEAGEDYEEALIRECREELGIEISVDHLFDERSDPEENKDLYFKFFLCSLKEGTPVSKEKQRFLWISPQELCDYPFAPADVEVVKKLINHYELV